MIRCCLYHTTTSTEYETSIAGRKANFLGAFEFNHVPRINETIAYQIDEKWWSFRVLHVHSKIIYKNGAHICKTHLHLEELPQE